MIAFFILVALLLCVKYLNIDKIKEIFGFDRLVVITSQAYTDLSNDYISNGNLYYYKLSKESFCTHWRIRNRIRGLTAA